MKRKIIINIVMGFFCPLLIGIRWIPKIFKAVVYDNYRVDGVNFGGLGGLLGHVFGSNTYLFLAFFILVFVLLPFQLIKDYRTDRIRPLGFIQKWSVLSGIILLWILIFGTFSNIWFFPLWHNIIYLALSLGFGLVCNSIFHISLDKRPAKSMEGSEEERY